MFESKEIFQLFKNKLFKIKKQVGKSLHLSYSSSLGLFFFETGKQLDADERGYDGFSLILFRLLNRPAKNMKIIRAHPPNQGSSASNSVLI